MMIFDGFSLPISTAFVGNAFGACLAKAHQHAFCTQHIRCSALADSLAPAVMLTAFCCDLITSFHLQSSLLVSVVLCMC